MVVEQSISCNKIYLTETFDSLLLLRIADKRTVDSVFTHYLVEYVNTLDTIPNPAFFRVVENFFLFRIFSGKGSAFNQIHHILIQL